MRGPSATSRLATTQTVLFAADAHMHEAHRLQSSMTLSRRVPTAELGIALRKSPALRNEITYLVALPLVLMLTRQDTHRLQPIYQFTNLPMSAEFGSLSAYTKSIGRENLNQFLAC